MRRNRKTKRKKKLVKDQHADKLITGVTMTVMMNPIRTLTLTTYKDAEDCDDQDHDYDLADRTCGYVFYCKQFHQTKRGN